MEWYYIVLITVAVDWGFGSLIKWVLKAKVEKERAEYYRTIERIMSDSDYTISEAIEHCKEASRMTTLSQAAGAYTAFDAITDRLRKEQKKDETRWNQ